MPPGSPSSAWLSSRLLGVLFADTFTVPLRLVLHPDGRLLVASTRDVRRRPPRRRTATGRFDTRRMRATFARDLWVGIAPEPAVKPTNCFVQQLELYLITTYPRFPPNSADSLSGHA